jgi:hypothetical protein
MAKGRRGPKRRPLSRQKKLRWYHRGAEALGVAVPSAVGKGYCCPLCLRASTDVRLFTAEDVPPRHRDGRPLVLTCKECNDRAGSQLDVHWARLSDAESFFRGELAAPLGVKLSYRGVEVTTDATSINREVTFRVVPEGSSEVAIRKLRQLAEEIDQQPEPFTITFYRSRFSEGRARLSVLRAAYLTAFAVMGYRFFGAWNPIRDQLLQPKVIDDGLRLLVRYDRDATVDRRQLAVVYEPADMWSVWVSFGRWTGVIPLLRDSKFYRPEELVGGFEFRGRTYDWPTEPSFGLPVL